MAGIPFLLGDTPAGLIYCPEGQPVDDELIGRGEERAQPRVRVVTPHGSTATQGG